MWIKLPNKTYINLDKVEWFLADETSFKIQFHCKSEINGFTCTKEEFDSTLSLLLSKLKIS